jgi:hypothetical protein
MLQLRISLAGRPSRVSISRVQANVCEGCALLYADVSLTRFVSAFLRADYSISCDADGRAFWLVYAAISVLAFPLGVPLFFFLLLLARVKRIKEQPIDMPREEVIKTFADSLVLKEDEEDELIRSATSTAFPDKEVVEAVTKQPSWREVYALAAEKQLEVEVQQRNQAAGRLGFLVASYEPRWCV